MKISVEEDLKEMLVNYGMWPDQADEVIAQAKEDKMFEALKGRWNDPVDEYSPEVLTASWISIKSIALEYIVNNDPKAWFRPMFEEKVVDAPHKVHKVKFQSQNHCLHVPLCAYNNAGRSEDFRKSLCVLS